MTQPTGIAGIVVGGVADGVILNDLDPGAQFVRLSKPEYVKPLASSTQQEPEAVETRQIYEILQITFPTGDETPPKMYAVLLPEGSSLASAFEKLMVSHYRQAMEDRVNEGVAANDEKTTD